MSEMLPQLFASSVAKEVMPDGIQQGNSTANQQDTSVNAVFGQLLAGQIRKKLPDQSNIPPPLEGLSVHQDLPVERQSLPHLGLPLPPAASLAQLNSTATGSTTSAALQVFPDMEAELSLAVNSPEEQISTMMPGQSIKPESVNTETSAQMSKSILLQQEGIRNAQLARQENEAAYRQNQTLIQQKNEVVHLDKNDIGKVPEYAEQLMMKSVSRQLGLGREETDTGMIKQFGSTKGAQPGLNELPVSQLKEWSASLNPRSGYESIRSELVSEQSTSQSELGMLNLSKNLSNLHTVNHGRSDALALAAGLAQAPGDAGKGHIPIVENSIRTLPEFQLNSMFGKSEWNNELGNRIAWMTKQEMPSAHIRLNPAHLGPLEVRVSMQNDLATVSFVSQNPVVREAIEGAIPRLREMFGEQGLDLNDVDISDRSHKEKEDNSNPQQPAYEHSNADSRQAEYDLPIPETEAVTLTDSHSLVDYFV